MKKGKHFNGKLTNKKIIILIILLILSITILLLEFYNRNKDNNDEKLKEIVNSSTKSEEVQTTEENITEIKTERMIMLEELQKENSDIVGWLEIPNSNISYPVLQGEDNSFYVNHNYKKEYSKNGSLFLDKDYDWSLPSTNLLIHGHNNRGTNEMFCGLMNYKKEEYYKTHPTIKFTTNQEDAEYEIISVFLSRVYYKSETNVFRYYYFINAANGQEFNDYVENSKKASLYNIEATATYGDQLMTLSTCEFSQEDGRLAVVARKITQGTE